jgi:hypothetical protein
VGLTCSEVAFPQDLLLPGGFRAEKIFGKSSQTVLKEEDARARRASARAVAGCGPDDSDHNVQEDALLGVLITLLASQPRIPPTMMIRIQPMSLPPID